MAHVPCAVVRGWRIADLDATGLLCSDSFPQYHSTAPVLRAWRNSRKAYVATVADKVVAFMLVEDDESMPDDAAALLPCVYVWLLVVAPKFRRCGIGTLLLNEAKTRAEVTAGGRVVLQVDQDNPAVSLYEKTGFRQYSEGVCDGKPFYLLVCSPNTKAPISVA